MSDDCGALFNSAARTLAAEHHDDSHYRWLTLSDDREAAALRRVLSRCWAASGPSRPTLRKGLEHERWGQHIGALAQLLTLGYFRQLGLAVESEPRFGKRTPDLLISTADQRALVEVRSLCGCGEQPWHGQGPPRAPFPRGPGGSRDREPRPGETISRKLERSRARRRARDRAEARAALQQSLAASVARALAAKAEAYRELCEVAELPYIVCLYQDSDDQLAPIVLDGPLWPPQLSAVLILGRLEDPRPGWLADLRDDRAAVILRGELILNDAPARPLPPALCPRGRRVFILGGGPAVPGWDESVAPCVGL